MKEMDVYSLSFDIFAQLQKQGFVLAVGNMETHNCMTVAWASIGYLWKKPMAFVYVRPQRYTYQFMEKNEYFSINFFDESYEKIVNYCGSHSGRDIDKMHIKGLTPVSYNNKVIYYNESQLVLICRKIYFDDIKPAHMLDKSVLKNYPTHDYHRLYYGEIEKLFHQV